MEHEQVWINGVNTENKLAVLKWAKETKINLVQVNGQRKYGGPPPDWVGEAPGIGSEVYIGKIPQNMYENKLIPLFQTVGKLYEFRLMMTFSGLNRGFAYARYASRRRAHAAIATLNGFEIVCGHRIIVSRSTEKCELLLSRIPRLLEPTLLKKMLQEITFGVEGVLLYENPVNPNEKMAIVKYRTHRAAAMAKKKLRQDPQCICGHFIAVEWLNSEVRQTLYSKRPQSDFTGPQALQRNDANPLEAFNRDGARNLFFTQQQTEVPALTPHYSVETSYALNYLQNLENKKQTGHPILPPFCENQEVKNVSRYNDGQLDDVGMNERIWNMEQILKCLFDLKVKRQIILTFFLCFFLSSLFRKMF
ncbi:dead end protein homolog 1-like [Pelobates fuscus]|uniref:dead end protein homolog 1-like n=1 Tax=Pelobates fuscus TaxID=191477 RepID=UPI002FE4E1B1